MSTNQIKCLGVIPARLESSRFPNKPLKDIAGKTLIERVWLQAKKAKNVTKLVVATNNKEIGDICSSKGIDFVMTSALHETGTDRVAEAAKILDPLSNIFDLVANIQGDMPFINPSIIDSTISSLSDRNQKFGMATIGTPITDREEFERSSVVKIALGENGKALYFSRSPIPFWRNFTSTDTVNEENPLGYKHMGLYIFRAATLHSLADMTKAWTEKRESLEQLRALAHGVEIRVNVVPRMAVEPSIEVDTPEDLIKAIEFAIKSER
jgi:3-deoxy-manno-octulosonate cytidylyltransferase (CMP-KDO synthetase)